MKLVRSLSVLLLVIFLFSIGIGYCEIIYTKDGRQIQGEITEVTEDTVWVETTEAEITEESGIDRQDIEKILNRDTKCGWLSEAWYNG